MSAATAGCTRCRGHRSAASSRLPARCWVNKTSARGRHPDEAMTDASTLGLPAPAVTVVVPVRNETGNVAPLIEEIAAALAGRAFEIVYVNDGSTDATQAEVAALM